MLRGQGLEILEGFGRRNVGVGLFSLQTVLYRHPRGLIFVGLKRLGQFCLASRGARMADLAVFLLGSRHIFDVAAFHPMSCISTLVSQGLRANG